MKKLTLLFTLVFITNLSIAQSYSTAIGVKGGYAFASGLNVKHDFGKLYGDFTLGGGRNYFGLSAAVEKQYELSDGLEWYFGAGGYLNSWRSSYYVNNEYYNNGVGFGALGLVGIEYTFTDFPINIGIDGGPVLNFTPYFDFDFGINGFLRFAIK